MFSAWRSARSVEAMYGPSKKCENAQPSGVSMVSAAATARSPQRIRKRHPASRVTAVPSSETRSNTWRGNGSSGVAGPWAARRDGVLASRTAVGEPSAVRTERRAGAGAGGTCSGMVGRLSFDRHWWREGGAGADGAVSSRGQEAGPGSVSMGAACRTSLDGRFRDRGANLLPCSRSLYDTCSEDVSSNRFPYEQQGPIRSAIHGNHPGSEPAPRP